MRLLTVEKIVDAALALLDEQGRFTMPDLAKRLGVSSSSIYHHVRGRNAIIELIRSRLAGPIDDVVAGLEVIEWEESLVRFARAYRDSFAKHPRAIPLLAAHQVSADAALTNYDALARALGRAGFLAEQQILWLRALDNYVLGAALNLTAPEQGGWGVSTRDGAAPSAAPTGCSHADQAFELGLRALLSGMRAELASRE
jgi:AcrR family transcriptional regulator